MRVLAMVMLIACTRERAEPVRQAAAPAVAPIPVVAPAPKPAPLLSPKAATLAAMTEFSIGPYGEAGDPHHAEEAARALAREPDAVPMFEALAQHPNRVARLYAYWGLRKLAPERAAEHRAPLLADRTEVTAFDGCMGESVATGDLVARVEKESM